MKIAVIGAGAIGTLVAGYLAQKGKEVMLVCHPEQLASIREKGITIDGVRGKLNVSVETQPILSRQADFIILAVKTQDVVKAAIENQRHIQQAIVLTTQNGVQADNLLSKIVDKNNIISSIVMFGATYVGPGSVVHNFERSWILGKPFGPNDTSVQNVRDILSDTFTIEESEDIMGMKYLKIFLNANNCITAILGISMQEAFKDLDVSRLAVSIWKEGLEIVNKSGIKLASLPDFPLERLHKLAAMPIAEAAKIFSQIMISLSKEPLYGSILQSIQRGKTSEIDYINGEFITIAKKNNLNSPLNEKLVEMVHQVEKRHAFFSKEDLISTTEGLVN